MAIDKHAGHAGRRSPNKARLFKNFRTALLYLQKVYITLDCL